MLKANLLLTITLLAVLIATSTAIFLRPDPLTVVVEVLESFSANLTGQISETLAKQRSPSIDWQSSWLPKPPEETASADVL